MNKHLKKCPDCNSKNIAEFLYGMPVTGPDLDRDLDQKKIILGGCSILENAPQFHCNECGHEWGIQKKNRLIKI